MCTCIIFIISISSSSFPTLSIYIIALKTKICSYGYFLLTFPYITHIDDGHHLHFSTPPPPSPSSSSTLTTTPMCVVDLLYLPKIGIILFITLRLYIYIFHT